ncbi:MAG TPA: hypothetical protein PK567_01775 [Bacillota bacterium]|nr:hypothetical protein [Bacillota bacterium]
MARYTNKIDAKGRIFVPAKVRDKLGSCVHITISLDSGYLSVYAQERFEHIYDQLTAMNGMDEKARKATRLILGNEMECELDAQGRITISSELWESIGAKPADMVCIYHMGDKLDICTKAFFESESKEELSEIRSLDLSEFNVTGL